MKYIILAYSDNVEPFRIPRQLTEINGEPLIKRTIRLLKENGAEDILITSADERFNALGAKRYVPMYNDYRPKENTGYWLSAFPAEIMVEPVTFLFGDVYYSEAAIKTIIETKTDFILFFCTYNNQDPRYIKKHDEPLAFKVMDCDYFIAHIARVKRLYDSGKCCRHPIAWELYRSINDMEINKHVIAGNCVVINDESCDIDTLEDVERLKERGLKNGNIPKA